MSELYHQTSEREYHLLGIPSYAGSLYSGTEAAPGAYREAGVITRLRELGHTIFDEGDVAIPAFLPRHNTPPIRNWPAPRLVWEATHERCLPLLRNDSRLHVLGGDCSIIVGVAHAMTTVYGKRVHILSVDGHVDAVPPHNGTCVGAAAMGLWFITHHSPFWHDPILNPEQVTVVGWSDPNNAESTGMTLFPLEQVRQIGANEIGMQALRAIAPDAVILLHFDVDVFDEQEMPAAYSPNPRGLTWNEGQTLLTTLLRDPRVRAIEVTEYSYVRDYQLIYAHKIVDLLGQVIA